MTRTNPGYWLLIVLMGACAWLLPARGTAQPIWPTDDEPPPVLLLVIPFDAIETLTRRPRLAPTAVARRGPQSAATTRGRGSITETARRGIVTQHARLERRVPDLRDPFVIMLPPSIAGVSPKLTLGERLMDALSSLWSQLIPAIFFFLVMLGWRRLFRTDPDMILRTRAGHQAFYLYFFIAGLLVLADFAGSTTFHRMLHLLSLFVLVLGVIQTLSVLAVDGFLARSRMIRVPVIVRDVTTLMLYLIVSIIVLSNFGVDLTGILTGSVVLTAVVGLAFQDTLGSIASGLALQVERPFQENDWIQFEDEVGRVLEINWRSTKMLNLRNEMVIIPNKEITGARLRNLSTPTATKRCEITIGLPYDEAPNHCKQLLEAAAKTDGVASEPPPYAALSSFDDSAVQYTLYFYVTSQALRIRIEDRVRTNIWYRLQRAGISVPFPIRDVTVHQAAERDEARDRERETNEALSAIVSIPFLEPLGEAERVKLAEKVDILDFGAGETVIQQGDQGASLFFIHHGEVEVLSSAAGLIQPRRVAILHTGDFFGEMSLMTGERRSATIRTLTDSTFFVIDLLKVRAIVDRPRM